MERALSILAQADSLLETISVKGADAYAMVNARKLLKAAYDLLTRKEAEANDSCVDGSGNSVD